MQNKLNDKLLYYKSRNYFSKQEFSESMYQISMFNPEGINYNHWIKFRRSTIEQIKHITPEGLYVLLGLLSHPYTINKESLQTSLTMINKHIEMKNMADLKLCLVLLEKHGFIQMSDFSDKINQQSIFNIYILYNSDESYNVPENDYWKPIPIDYINKCLLILNPIDVCIVFVLILGQNFFIPKEKLNDSNIRIYYYIETSYAFPELETMAELFNTSRQNIRNHIIKLSKQEIISYMFHGNKVYNENGELFNPNYQYRVKLLCRMEYIHLLFKLGELYDHRELSIKAKIQDDLDSALRDGKLQSLCRPHDYIADNFDKHMQLIISTIQNKDFITYNELITSKSQLIEDLDNKDLKPMKKKKEFNTTKTLSLKECHEQLKNNNLTRKLDTTFNFDNMMSGKEIVF